MKLLLFGLAFACSSALAAAPFTAEYAHPGGVSLKLDGCVPDGPGPFPAVILIHGGGWNTGDRTGGKSRALIAPMEDPLSAAGYAWFSIDYRLAPKATWPDPLEDVNAAVRWVKAHAQKYHLDPDRIAISGESAGGHLALMATVTANADTRVAATVIFYGPWDLTDQYHFHGDKMGAGMGGLFKSQVFDAATVEKLKAASPMTYLKPGLPPILLVHGNKDVQVRYDSDPIYQAKLRALGDTCDLLTIPGGPHGMIYWDKLDPNYKTEVVAWLGQNMPRRSWLARFFRRL